MIYGSVCSGIEAATVAWHPLGWRAAFYSEIEAYPCALLKHYYPNTPNHGDMTRFQEWPDADLDVLVGGTPCQSFSVAGLRKGLADPRGNLMLTFGAIARRYRPRWLVWENVPGVLSSNGGRDFGTFLGMLAELGYGFAYRVLDAQYFGVPQRRRRVFVVGCLGDWRRAAAVLFERHSLQGNPAPSRQAGEKVAGTVKGGSGSRGYPDPSDGNGGGLIDLPATVGALTDGAHMEGGLTGRTPTQDGSLPFVSRCLNAGGQGRQDWETETLIPTTGGGFDVAHSLRGEGFDAGEDGTGRGTPLVPVAFDTTQITSAANYSNPKQGDPCLPLAAGAHPPAIAFGWQNSSQQGASASASHTPTLDRSKVPAIAFSSKDHGADAGEIAPTLRSMGHDGSHANGGGQVAVAVALRGREGGATAELSNVPSALRASGGGGDKAHVLTAMQVRRLTPRECERLQGFPDDWTLIPYRNKPAADGPRYKALGNSMAVPVMRWIGERIALVDEIKEQQHAA